MFPTVTVADIKEEIEKTLHWLVPVATNTAKVNHGFGWFGEWASTGSEVNLKNTQTNIMRIETFHHADKDKVEKYILELLLWLQRLAIKNGAGIDVGVVRSTPKDPHVASPLKTDEQPTIAHPPLLTIKEQDMVQLVSKKVWIRGMSKSLDFDRVKVRLGENSKLTKSWSLSSNRSMDFSFSRISSKLPVIDIGVERERALDVIDRVEVVR